MKILDIWFNLNKLFDRIEEPFKFLITLFLVLVGIVGISSGNNNIMVMSAVYFLLLVLFRGSYLQKF